MPHQVRTDVKIATDTLLPGNLSGNWTDSIHPVLITSDNGGFVLGNNGYGDRSKGELFPVSQSYLLQGGIFWFGYKSVTGTPDTIKFVAWDMNGWGGSTLAGENDQACPGTYSAFVKVALDAVDTAQQFTNAYVATFGSPVIMYYDYVLGFDMSAFADDTIGMVSSTSGEGDSLERVWEQWSNGKWYTLQAAGYNDNSLDIDAMIFPIVDMTGAGLCDSPFVNGTRLSVYPNPVSDILTIFAETEQPSKSISIRILDAGGRLIKDMGTLSAQSLSTGITLDVASLPAGSYYILLSADSHRQAQRVVITH